MLMNIIEFFKTCRKSTVKNAANNLKNNMNVMATYALTVSV